MQNRVKQTAQQAIQVKAGSLLHALLCTDLLLSVDIKDHDCLKIVTRDSNQTAVAVPTAILAACSCHQHRSARMTAIL